MTALADSLASGQLAPEDVDLMDKVTRTQVLQTIGQIGASGERPASGPPRFFADEHRPASAPSVRALPAPAGPPPALEPGSADGRALAAIGSRNPAHLARFFAETHPMRPEWVRFVVSLLADPECAALANVHLRRAAPANVGALTDALLSRRVELAARRHLTDILGTVATRRSADGLLAALDTEPFEIRFRAACALSWVVQKNPTVIVPHEPVFDAAERAIDLLRLVWAGSAIDHQGALSESGLQAGRTLAYCIRLLSIVLPAGPLDLALDAIGSEDRARRGTGLEYLDNALPPRLKDGLLPFLEQMAVTRYARRDDSVILSELERTEHRSLRTLTDLRARLRPRAAQPG